MWESVILMLQIYINKAEIACFGNGLPRQSADWRGNDRLFYMQRPMPTMTLIGVALPLFYPSSSPVMSATSGSMKKPSRMPRFSAMPAFFRRVWASSNST